MLLFGGLGRMLFRPRLYVNTLIHRIVGIRKHVRLDGARIWKKVTFEGDNFVGKQSLISYCDMGKMSYIGSRSVYTAEKDTVPASVSPAGTMKNAGMTEYRMKSVVNVSIYISSQ